MKRKSEISFGSRGADQDLSELEKKPSYNQSSKRLLDPHNFSDEDTQRELKVRMEMQEEAHPIEEPSDRRKPPLSEVYQSLGNLSNQPLVTDKAYSDNRFNLDHKGLASGLPVAPIQKSDLLRLINAQAKLNEQLFRRE